MALIRAIVLRLVVLAVALGIGFGPAHAHAGGPGGPCLHRTLAPSSVTAQPAAHRMAAAHAAHHHGATPRPAGIVQPAATSTDDPGPANPAAACADACVCAVCITLPAFAAAADDAPAARLRVGPALSGALPGIEPDRPDPPPRSAV